MLPEYVIAFSLASLCLVFSFGVVLSLSLLCPSLPSCVPFRGFVREIPLWRAAGPSLVYSLCTLAP